MATWRTGRIRANEVGRQIGGAMDLAVGAKRVWVVMEHVTKDGQARILRRCSYPLTAAACVSRVYTNLAVLDVTPRGFVVIDMVAGPRLRRIAGADGGAAAARLARRQHPRRAIALDLLPRTSPSCRRSR